MNKCKSVHLFKRKSVILTTKYEGYGKGVVEKFISMEDALFDGVFLAVWNEIKGLTVIRMSFVVSVWGFH